MSKVILTTLNASLDVLPLRASDNRTVDLRRESQAAERLAKMCREG